MTDGPKGIPPGPADSYPSDCDLLVWLGMQLECFGDVFRASIYGTETYVVNRPEYVEHVLLRNWQNYPKGQAIKRIALLLGNGLMVSKGDLWTRQRRMIQPAFNRTALGSLTGLIVEANARLIEKWEHAAEAGLPVNVTQDVSLMILDIVLQSIFGLDYPEIEPRFRLVAEESARDLEFAVVFTSLAETVSGIAEKRRRESRQGDDFLGQMMQARERGSGQAMPDAQLTKEVMTLIVAGHETTASTLNWTWYLLSQNPESAARLAAELDRPFEGNLGNADELKQFQFTRNVIEEALRLYPPGWLMTRRAVRDDRIGDYFVAAGTEIYISPYYIQRDPRLWDSPEAFDPDRFLPERSKARHPLAMIPFSVGPRNCVGEHFARLEMQIHLMMVAKRLILGYQATTRVPAMAAGVNLLSAEDLIMTVERRGRPGSVAAGSAED